MQKRIYFIFFDNNNTKRIIPVNWTNLSTEQDPFRHISAGRAYFRFTDLIQITRLITEYNNINKENNQKEGCNNV